MLKHISSRDNDLVKYARKLAGSASVRAQEGLFFAEGKKLCQDLASTLAPKVAFFTQDFLRANPALETLAEENYIINQPVNDKLSDTQTPQGIYCLFKLPQNSVQAMQPQKGILVCEELQNPANAGAVLRSAAAFGFGGAWLLQGSADPFGPKALRAGMGAVGHIPVAYGHTLQEALQSLGQMGCTIYATALQGAQTLAQTPVQKPFALFVGNEGAGLTPQAVQAAHHRVYIPMQNGVESLNAAVAASVLMYHFTQVQ